MSKRKRAKYSAAIRLGRFVCNYGLTSYAEQQFLSIVFWKDCQKRVGMKKSHICATALAILYPFPS
jgi:hypothetical protein